jgi:poly(A) polymerase
VPPGRGVGLALKRLQANWIRAGFPREPEVLARLLAEAVGD